MSQMSSHLCHVLPSFGFCKVQLKMPIRIGIRNNIGQKEDAPRVANVAPRPARWPFQVTI
mgnify:CR=1 FL=1